ncbi:aldo/keto reductase [Aureitalea sp. L0-47]|uniref:aldo/keto reductase n=1 Tax=Aureitalea sp. L0-47 TaxID=2816962 RepID=UPI0022381329|nr:aldo/keto reductase [Aureitalea sp. L0-47]MCW5520759.1 aldo/keto reductase [Aureitalea sp. L0-47]
MKTLKFANGDSMHAVGLGTWKATGDTVNKAVKDAINAGMRHIDTAAVYQNESEIGEAIEEVLSEGKIKREDLFITSKLWNNEHQPEDVLPALKESLRKLKLDYLDLYLIHWPVAFKKDVFFPGGPDDYISLDECPIGSTWKQMEAAYDKGLSKHIGVSNFSTRKLEELKQTANYQPEVNQVELHPLLQQNGLYDYCKKENILLTAYSPLGSGDRDSSMKGENEPDLFELETIRDIADKHSVTPANVLIGWHVNRGTSVIPKSTSPSHIESNFKAGNLELDSDDMERIASLDRNYRYITGKFFEAPEKGYTNIYDE